MENFIFCTVVTCDFLSHKAVQSISNKRDEAKLDRTRKLQPYHQRLREYRFYASIGHRVNIGCE